MARKSVIQVRAQVCMGVRNGLVSGVAPDSPCRAELFLEQIKDHFSTVEKYHLVANHRRPQDATVGDSGGHSSARVARRRVSGRASNPRLLGCHLINGKDPLIVNGVFAVVISILTVTLLHELIKKIP